MTDDRDLVLVPRDWVDPLSPDDELAELLSKRWDAFQEVKRALEALFARNPWFGGEVEREVSALMDALSRLQSTEQRQEP